MDRPHQAGDFAILKKQAVSECSREHSINEVAIKDIMNHVQVTQDEEVKCWISCVMKTLEISKEGRIDWDRLEEILISGVTTEDRPKVHQVVDICRSQVVQDDKNECQVAYFLADCKIKHWNELGLPKANWDQLAA